MLLRHAGLRVNELLARQFRDNLLDGPAFIVYVIRSKKAGKTDYDPVSINQDPQSRPRVLLSACIKVHAYKRMGRVFGGGGKRGPRKKMDQGLWFVFESAGLASTDRKVEPKGLPIFFTQPMIDGGTPMPIASKMIGHVPDNTTGAHYDKFCIDRRRGIQEGISV